MKKQHVEFLLDRANSRLEGCKQLAAVRLAQSDIDDAVKEINRKNEWDPKPIVKIPINLYSDVELLAELQKRLSERSYPARA